MRSLSGSAFTDFTEYLPRPTFGILKKKMRHLDLIGWSPDWAELILAPAALPVSIQLLQVNSCGLRPPEFSQEVAASHNILGKNSQFRTYSQKYSSKNESLSGG